MRRVLAVLAAAAALCPAAADAAPTPQQALTRALTTGMRAAGRSSGADVVDLSTGQTVYSSRATTGRLPASVEKLYTTSAALIRFGPNGTFQTRVYGVGALDASGIWHGTLYLRGGGDPTFGAQGFDRYHYGAGATMQRLVANLIRVTGIKALAGAIVGDEHYFDSDRGTPATGNQANLYVQGLLSGLAYDRGFTTSNESTFQAHPALFAAQQFAAALRAAHVGIPKHTPIRAGTTPAGARSLTSVHSPRMATLLALTNTPSDNFFAEMLTKDLGASFGGAGTTAAGVSVIRSQVVSSFGIDPRFNDGSGLSYGDSTSPQQVVTLLSRMVHNATFYDSLAIAGETGTLSQEMNGTVAQGRCRGKTGTLQAVSNLVGYCTAADGHTLAFAFLMNAIDPNTAHPIQNRMAEALARYTG